MTVETRTEKDLTSVDIWNLILDTNSTAGPSVIVTDQLTTSDSNEPPKILNTTNTKDEQYHYLPPFDPTNPEL